MTRRTRSRTRGFTLAELLVVIAIIALLAAMITPALYRVVIRARENRIIQEVSLLSGAVEGYKHKYGDHPPDFSNADKLNRHLRKAFPRWTGTLANTDMRLPVDHPGYGSNSPKPRFPQKWDKTTGQPTGPAVVGDIDPTEALVFFLTMIKTDPREPFNGDGEREKLFDFDPGRFVDPDCDGWLSYAPKDGQDVPYVYFVAPYEYNIPAPPYIASYTANNGDLVRPFKRRTGQAIDWANVGTFQIISAGLDGEFGKLTGGLYKCFPDGSSVGGMVPYTEEDYDNITNFGDGKILRDSME